MALQYVKIRLTQFIIYKHVKYCKLVNVIVTCFEVYGKASRGLLYGTLTPLSGYSKITVNVF